MSIEFWSIIFLLLLILYCISQRDFSIKGNFRRGEWKSTFSLIKQISFYHFRFTDKIYHQKQKPLLLWVFLVFDDTGENKLSCRQENCLWLKLKFVRTFSKLKSARKGLKMAPSSPPSSSTINAILSETQCIRLR